MCPGNSIAAMLKVCQDVVALDRRAAPNEFVLTDWEPIAAQAREAITYKGGGTIKP